MTGPRTAFLLGTLFLAGFGLNLWMVSSERKARREVELVDQPTAVGDHNFFKPPAGERLRDVTMKVDGRLLAPPEKKGDELNDEDLRRAVVEDSGMFILYRVNDTDKKRKKYENSLFLKLGKNEFLRLEFAK